jgi:hypothetical protein
MRVLGVSLLSWAAGFLAYRATLAIFWHQSISRGDLRAVIFWSALATTTAVAIVYAPLMFALRRGRTPEW